MRSRRVGTFTLGITLVSVGAVYLFEVLFPQTLNLVFAMRFWPVVLILLGIEVLLSFFINKEEKLRCDGWAIFLVICLIVFAWCMALGLTALEYGGVYRNGYWCL